MRQQVVVETLAMAGAPIQIAATEDYKHSASHFSRKARNLEFNL